MPLPIWSLRPGGFFISVVPAPMLAPTLVGAANRVREWGMICGGRWQSSARPLQIAAELEAAAALHAEDMAVRGFFSHENPIGLGPEDRARATGYSGEIAENIAWGAETTEAAMATWLASPRHCKSLLSRRFSQAGAAWAASRGKTFWVIVLGRPGGR